LTFWRYSKPFATPVTGSDPNPGEDDGVVPLRVTSAAKLVSPPPFSMPSIRQQSAYSAR
jgi:hypothetical protein